MPSLRKCDNIIYRFSNVVKVENFHFKNLDIFNMLAQNINCGYTIPVNFLKFQRVRLRVMTLK